MADWWDDPRRNPLMAAWLSLPPEARRAYQSGAATIADMTPMAALRDTVYGAQDVGRGLLNVSPGEIGQGLLSATLGAAGIVPGGRSGKVVKEVTEEVAKQVAKQAKPLTREQFHKLYSQHVDLRGRQAGNSDEVLEAIRREGWRRGSGMTTLPPYGGGVPADVIEQKYAPRAGDMAYLIPKEGMKKSGHVVEGWKPQPHEAFRVDADYPDMYEEYLKRFSNE